MNRISGCVVAAAVMVIMVAPSLTQPMSAQGKEAGFADRLYVVDGGIGRAGNAGDWQNMMVPPGHADRHLGKRSSDPQHYE